MALKGVHQALDAEAVRVPTSFAPLRGACQSRMFVSTGRCIFDFSARRGLGRQLKDSRRPECRRGARGLSMLYAADIAIRTDAHICTGTGAPPAETPTTPRSSSSESATDDGAVPCTFFVFGFPPARDGMEPRGSRGAAWQAGRPRRERSAATRTKHANLPPRGRTPRRRERRIQSATDIASPCAFCSVNRRQTMPYDIIVALSVLVAAACVLRTVRA